MSCFVLAFSSFLVIQSSNKLSKQLTRLISALSQFSSRSIGTDKLPMPYRIKASYDQIIKARSRSSTHSPAISNRTGSEKKKKRKFSRSFLLSRLYVQGWWSKLPIWVIFLRRIRETGSWWIGCLRAGVLHFILGSMAWRHHVNVWLL